MTDRPNLPHTKKTTDSSGDKFHLTIGHKVNLVILDFGVPTRRLEFAPEQADELARWLLTAAIRARSDNGQQ